MYPALVIVYNTTNSLTIVKQAFILAIGFLNDNEDKTKNMNKSYLYKVLLFKGALGFWLGAQDTIQTLETT